MSEGIVVPLRLFGDPVLRTPTDLVTEFDDALANLIANMFATMHAAGGVGLAANQIGVSRQVFVFDCLDATAGRQTGHMVNPRLMAKSGKFHTEPEGCLSIPNLECATPRQEVIELAGQDKTGADITIVGHGLLARCLEHEFDHVQGRLYIDGLSGSARKAAFRAIRDPSPPDGLSRELL